MRRLLAVAALLVALSGQSGDHGDPARCARALGIAWSVADGATERLDSFAGCVR
jgi:hypothetical protein